MPLQNPFDSDDDDDDESLRSSRASAPSSYLPYSNNPFDDEEKHDDAKLSHISGNMSKAEHLGSFSHAKNNPFDEENHGIDSKVALSTEKSVSKGARSSIFPIKQKASSAGQSSIAKKVQMIKETGMKHASKFVEGSIEQAQKMKESASKAFESRENQKDHQNHPKDHQNKQKVHEERHQKYHGNNHFYDDDNDNAKNRYDRDELFAQVESRPSNGARENTSRQRYDEGQFRKQDLEYRSLQELEGYAVQKSEDTTSTLQNCLKVAEEMKGDATKTLLALHEQGQQLKRTHELAVEMDQNLDRGEKVLGTLGGIFSRTWKPKKSQPLAGPVNAENDSAKRRAHHLNQRVALGIDRINPKERTTVGSLNSSDRQTTHEKLEVERAKQDDALTDLSDVLDNLKVMSIDMGLEISSQINSMDQLEKDTTILDDRVKDANHRGRRLLGR